MDLVKFFEFLTAILFAFWFRREIPLFAKRINQQTYNEFYSLVDFQLDYRDFEKQSNLKAKQSKLSILFFFIFPLVTWLSQDYLISVVIIILCFLTVLDILYYLTEIRYLAILFLLTLYSDNLETFYFTVFFFIFIHFFSIFTFQKEGFGLGDSLLLIALSPLFTLEQMLQLVLIASVLGITYYLVERRITSQKRQKLPFIPFISVATFIIIYLN
ncbi:MAG: prepilin peptidase [Haemophilus parahaemolyticus]|uniref:prepilin peptidase n=1 Tax=Haemophilus parahaemolyticus TaxID=735 RepID=UPI0026EB4FBA|nr:prepilin peptidase [Haemophilus parahaemolyticus]MBS6009065.1 prepilin peptidase [Haemophilus parahaemolyticus]